MTSTCPGCMAQIDHDSDASEVTCQSCSNVFNPQEILDDLPPLDSSMFLQEDHESSAEKEPEALVLEESMSALDDSQESLEEESLPPVVDKASQFKKSEELFEELRAFGENMAEKVVAKKPPPPNVNGQKNKGIQTPLNNSVSKVLVTAGTHFDGYRLETYFFPVTVSLAANGTDADLVKKALSDLAEQALRVGANALIDVKWCLSGDFKRIQASGTPVLCRT